MKHTTFNVSFYCRPSKADKKGLAPIEVSILINGRRELLTLPRKERPEEFKTALASKRNNDIKEYVEATRRRINEITTEMMEGRLELTTSNLKTYFQHGGVRHYSIENLFDEYLAIVAKRAESEVTQKTYRKYELARDKFYKVIDKDLPVTSITSSVIAEFMRVLRKDYNQVTANGYMVKIRSIGKYAMSKGLLSVNPFIGLRIRRGEMEVEFLSEAELAKIRDTDFKNDAINRIRDLFVFQANSGLSYCDMAAVRPSDIQYNESGQPFIHKRRAKTNVFFTSVILPDGVEVLKKYNNRLPIITNTKYNASLKFIKDICQIEKPLHTHIARHTYATLCLNRGIRLEVVSKLLGHTNTRITQHYAKMLQKNIVDEVQEAFQIEQRMKEEKEALDNYRFLYCSDDLYDKR